MGKSRAKGLAVSIVDIADWLKDKYGFPKDTIITRFDKVDEQDAFMISIISSEFPEHSDLDMLNRARLAPDYKYHKEDK